MGRVKDGARLLTCPYAKCDWPGVYIRGYWTSHIEAKHRGDGRVLDQSPGARGPDSLIGGGRPPLHPW